MLMLRHKIPATVCSSDCSWRIGVSISVMQVPFSISARLMPVPMLSMVLTL